MLTRREFLKQAGVAVVAAGVAAVVPKTLQAEKPCISTMELLGAKLQYTADNVRTAPSKNEYNLLVYGESLVKNEYGEYPEFLTSAAVYKPGWIVSIDRETLIAHGVDWEPQVGDICSLGVFVEYC